MCTHKFNLAISLFELIHVRSLDRFRFKVSFSCGISVGLPYLRLVISFHSIIRGSWSIGNLSNVENHIILAYY